MIYLSKDDLIDVIQQHLLDDSIQMTDSILDSLEHKAIAFASSYISGRYNVSLVFNAENPLRHPVLIQALAMIVVYRAVRRNAARKVPEDYKELYNEAIKILENIQAGKQRLDTLPVVEKVDGSGKPSTLMWGNSTNKDYFL